MHHANRTFSWLVASLLLTSVARAANESPLAPSSTAPSSTAPISTARIAEPQDDERWLISTRSIGCRDGDPAALRNLDVRRYVTDSGWTDSTLQEFLAGDPRLAVIYAHGNRVEWNESVRLGEVAYESIRSASHQVPRMRFVTWSWPSDTTRGPLRDARIKGDRADIEGSYLGWFLGQLHPRTPVSLFGYSYGARVISGALHLLGGGELNGISLPAESAGSRRPIRATYLAAAVDQAWLCPGRCHARSLDAIDRLLVLYNPCDPVLSRFWITDRYTKPIALGFAGTAAYCLGDGASHTEQLDVSSMIGRTHQESRYWCHAGLVHQVCRTVLWDPDVRETDVRATD